MKKNVRQPPPAAAYNTKQDFSVVDMKLKKVSEMLMKMHTRMQFEKQKPLITACVHFYNKVGLRYEMKLQSKPVAHTHTNCIDAAKMSNAIWFSSVILFCGVMRVPCTPNACSEDFTLLHLLTSKSRTIEWMKHKNIYEMVNYNGTWHHHKINDAI